MTDNRTWHLRVDNAPRRVDEDAADELFEQLADLRPGLALGEEAMILTLSVEAPTLRHAIATGLQRVEAATGARATGIEAITWDELEKRLTEPQIPDLVGYAEIGEMLGVSRQRARQLADLDGFPPAVVTTATGPLRVEAAVRDWAKTRRTTGGRPRNDTDADD